MSGTPGRDAKAALRRSSVIVPIVVVLLVGAFVLWVFHFRLP